MKKYLTIAVIFILFLAFIHYMTYEKGFYFNIEKNPAVSTNFYTKNGKIYHNENNSSRPFTIKGVDIHPGFPGHHQSEHSINYKTYLKWFEKISDMGANTIRVSTLMNDNFYDALYDFNTNRENPLYLLQGIRVEDYPSNCSKDALNKDFSVRLLADMKSVIDCIHGQKNILLNETNGMEEYCEDVSPWVLGFLIGEYWNDGTIAYTNHEHIPSPFKGTYVESTEKATVFENMLAQIMDTALSYESRKYKQQHLVSFSSSPSSDPFTYRENFAGQMPKFVSLNIEHIKARSNVKSGLFASYRMYDFNNEFVQYINAVHNQALTEMINSLDTSSYYRAYTDLLCKYHTVPVVITGYGYSSSRGIEQVANQSLKTGLTEKEQGQALVDAYQDFIASGCCGATINSWQDDWEAKSWNTSFATNQNIAYLWNDVQTYDQGFGLLKFEHYKKIGKNIIDGKNTEWTHRYFVTKSASSQVNPPSLFVYFDEAYVYFAIIQKNLSEKDKFYIPLDITPKSGTQQSFSPNLQFDRPIDFIIEISGKENSRLLVQDRYSAMRENYLTETTGIDPFVYQPRNTSPAFETVSMVLKNNTVFEDLRTASRKDKWLPIFPTGKLTHGTTNRKDKNFNSQADFCFGKNILEIRIPWQLLNFYDPAHGIIHDDYYIHYGVQPLKVSHIYAGIAVNPDETPIALSPIPLPSWSKPNTTETLKSSYYMIQDIWKGVRN